jgi:hypothetical protein
MEQNDYMADDILIEHAEDVWNFVTSNSCIYKDYSNVSNVYSMAEYVKKCRWKEFLEYVYGCK